jgi:hypothetical protein
MVPRGGVSAELELISLAERQHQLVTVADVRRVGISGHRWQRLRDEGWWIPVSPSHFRHVATPVDLRMRVYAGAGWLGGGAALFGATALWWLGVEVAVPTRPEFLVPRSGRGLVTGLTVHTTRRWDRGDFIHHEAVRTSTAARAIVDLASQGPTARTLENVIDSAIHRRRTSASTLRRRLAALDGRGRTGCVLLRELLLDTGGESYLERRFLALVRRWGFSRPKSQVTFRGATGKPLRVDFMFGTVVVEVSGRLGHSTDRDRQLAGRRRVALEDRGFRVIEFTTADVIDDPEYVRRTLVNAIHVSSSSDTLQKNC